MNVGASAGANAAVVAAISNAVKAFGALTKIEPEAFESLLTITPVPTRLSAIGTARMEDQG